MHLCIQGPVETEIARSGQLRKNLKLEHCNLQRPEVVCTKGLMGKACEMVNAYSVDGTIHHETLISDEPSDGILRE